MDTKHILNLIEERKDELFELLSSFVKFNTENFRSSGNEEKFAKHLHKICQDLGLESDIYSPLEIDGFENHPDYMPGGAHQQNEFIECDKFVEYTKTIAAYIIKTMG